MLEQYPDRYGDKWGRLLVRERSIEVMIARFDEGARERQPHPKAAVDSKILHRLHSLDTGTNSITADAADDVHTVAGSDQRRYEIERPAHDARIASIRAALSGERAVDPVDANADQLPDISQCKRDSAGQSRIVIIGKIASGDRCTGHKSPGELVIDLG